MSESLQVLAVEPWFGGSHRSALDGLAVRSQHEYQFVTLPARHWKWRMQGSALALAQKTRYLLTTGYRPDVVFASSMLNLPAYLSLMRDQLFDVPAVLYMHENQLTYAVPEGDTPDLTYGFINYLSCMTADRIAFNSGYHLESYAQAMTDLLSRLPDAAHGQTVEEILAKSTVLHLGIDAASLDACDEREETASGGVRPLAILWNHRWEYDKNPEAFFRVVDRLDDAGLPFDLILLGQDFESHPAVFDQALARHERRILQFGHVSVFSEYAAWLHRADVEVSTADHEFFGIAVLEAVHCGCHPLLPNRLSYPELFGHHGFVDPSCAPVLYENESQLFEVLAAVIRGEMRTLPLAQLRKMTAPFDWRRRAPAFDQILSGAARGAAPR